MSQKEIAALVILFAILMSLSISGFFDKTSFSKPPSSNQIQIAKSPTPIPTAKPFNVPIIRLSHSPSPSRIQTNLSPTPAPLSKAVSPAATSSAEPAPKSFGVFGIGKTPFGGKILSTQDCDPLFCGGANQLIVVGPPRGGVFAETKATTIYREFDISVGNWVLGLAGAFEVCWNFVCSFDGCICIPTGAGAEIKIIGTSK